MRYLIVKGARKQALFEYVASGELRLLAGAYPVDAIADITKSPKKSPDAWVEFRAGRKQYKMKGGKR